MKIIITLFILFLLGIGCILALVGLTFIGLINTAPVNIIQNKIGNRPTMPPIRRKNK